MFADVIQVTDTNENTKILSIDGPLMPLLFNLGQHWALVAVQVQLKDDERFFAFLDDVHVTSPIFFLGGK